VAAPFLLVSAKLHIEQDPPLVGVVRHRLQNEIMIEVVEEPFDVHIDHPVGSPATLPASPDRVQRATSRPVPVGVRVEDLLHVRSALEQLVRLRAASLAATGSTFDDLQRRADTALTQATGEVSR
jgi:hypothetical protein